MHRCSCSSTALELFIKDLAGLNIRHAAPSRTPTRQRLQTRAFRSSRASRQLETVSTASLDDSFVPFDLESSNGVRKDERKRDRTRDQTGERDEEWHAEIEIVGQWPKRTVDDTATHESLTEGIGTVVQEAEGDGKLVREGKLGEGEGNVVAGVPLVGLQARQWTSSGSRATLVASASAQSPAEMTRSEPAAAPSRAENRLARKQRRMIAGTWGPQKEQQTETPTVGPQTEAREVSVLDMLETAEEKRAREKKGKEKKAKEVTEDTSAPDRKRAKKSANEAVVSSKKDSKTAKSTPVAAKAEPKAPREREGWQIQKSALASKFGSTGWSPPKRVSPDTISGIRSLHASDPAAYPTALLAEHFKISPEAIRRILRSKWRPSEEEAERRREGWEKRGLRKWRDMGERGMRVPRVWRERGVERVGKGKREEGKKRDRLFREKERAEREEGVGMLGGIEGVGYEERLL